MKKITFVFAGFAISVASHQAVACDWGAHASNNKERLRSCTDHSASGYDRAHDAEGH
jgi:hypothetical protein